MNGVTDPCDSMPDHLQRTHEADRLVRLILNEPNAPDVDARRRTLQRLLSEHETNFRVVTGWEDGRLILLYEGNSSLEPRIPRGVAYSASHIEVIDKFDGTVRIQKDRVGTRGVGEITREKLLPSRRVQRPTAWEHLLRED